MIDDHIKILQGPIGQLATDFPVTAKKCRCVGLLDPDILGLRDDQPHAVSLDHHHMPVVPLENRKIAAFRDLGNTHPPDKTAILIGR